ncbi:hypothetical protein OFN13_31235, partial [Escherichia coli]|nr:hypothetical protein [Escherichia coli]
MYVQLYTGSYACPESELFYLSTQFPGYNLPVCSIAEYFKTPTGNQLSKRHPFAYPQAGKRLPPFCDT